MQHLTDSPIGTPVPVHGNMAFVPNPLPESLDLGPETISLLDRSVSGGRHPGGGRRDDTESTHPVPPSFPS